MYIVSSLLTKTTSHLGFLTVLLWPVTIELNTVGLCCRYLYNVCFVVSEMYVWIGQFASLSEETELHTSIPLEALLSSFPLQHQFLTTAVVLFV